MVKFYYKTVNNSNHKCTIRLLDDTEILECEFQSDHKGLNLLNYVCQQLNIIEKDYFGLRFVDIAKQRHWLDLKKPILKQVREMNPVLFSFRVKFYPPNPANLSEETTRYFLFLQLKRDLLHGRLYCSQNEAALLAAYIVQAELGDYDPEICIGNYVSNIKLLLKQTLPIEKQILEIHQTQLKGQSSSAVELLFLKKACQLETYGVDPHVVKDHKGNTLYVGINHLGVLTFQGSKKTRQFNWSEIQKINYEGKMFIIHLVFYEKKHTVGFRCSTTSGCRYLWRCAVEKMLFFTLKKAADAPVMTGGGFFSWGTKFKYFGRTEKEILQDTLFRKIKEPDVSLNGNLMRKSCSVPATPCTPAGSDLSEMRCRSLPKADHYMFYSKLHPDYPPIFGDCPKNSLPCLQIVSTSQDHDLGKSRVQDFRDLNECDDYYFRDSFDRSSCDSQSHTNKTTTITSSQKCSRNHSPLHSGSGTTHGTGSKILSPKRDVTHNPLLQLSDNHQDIQNSINTKNDITKFNLFQVFIPSFLFVVISLITATIIIMESDSDLVKNVNNLPEMISLRKHYYEPMKNFFANRFLKFMFKKEVKH
ncbi:FERM domain-containing protein, putative [Pediculus humanus corporis]|uniref:Moesin/ezrin/radixin homolog 1 n=1 Tax=Pediculus humanus subsp. corporis TaxID=121224 RepID=E0VQN4_PEDHC|nr:FERM domain-containing protein, putative [Pediculus humanus corporis]EEB15690.1 FERM domain-containing protein, putative [Pediculus humanus corporis]